MPVHTEPDVQEFPCSQPVKAVVRLGAGTIDVIAEDRPVVTVAVTPYGPDDASRAAAENTKIQFTGDRVSVETPETGGGWIFRRNGRVRVELRVPLDSSLQARTGSADVHAEGQLADVEIQTGSGDTYVTKTVGNLSVDSGSGDVRTDEVGGALHVRTASGDVSAASVTGPASVNVASGDVEIEDAHGPVKASSASGDIRISTAHSGQIKLNSASGDVSVGVPSGTRVWLDLVTMSGSTTSDLDMAAAAPQGGAQLSVEVRTMSGDINIHRVS